MNNSKQKPKIRIPEFPSRLETIREVAFNQAEELNAVACWYADALLGGGVVHIYANGHSRITVEELVVRMGALTGFHPILSNSLTNFTDVVGADGLRICQRVEQVEGLGAALLDEVAVAAGEPLIVVSATGQTQAAVDMALEWSKRYPANPLVCIASKAQASTAAPKHSSGKTLWHVAEEAQRAVFLDNGMPLGDLSVSIQGGAANYDVCPLSSIGALTLVHCLNELTMREIDARGATHTVLRNMHLGGYGPNYDEWLADQRKRYSKALYNPEALTPNRS